MAMILCEVHNVTPAKLVSFSIKQDYLQKKEASLDSYEQVQVTILNEGDVVNYWISKSIINQFHIPTSEILTVERFDSYQLPMSPLCGKCFKKWIGLDQI